VSGATISLWIAIVAVSLTTAITAGLRAGAAARRARADRYRERIAETLVGFAVGATEEPPSAPRGRLEHEVMHAELGRLAPHVKGGARDRLTSLFASFGLINSARRDLRSHHSLRAIRAAELVGTMRAEDCVPTLRAQLTSTDRHVRIACARALAELGEVDALSQIADAVSGDAGHENELGEILMGFGGRAESFLSARLRCGRTAGQRRVAAATLGEIHATAAVADLVTALTSPDDELAACSARALGQIGDRSAAGPLIALLEQPRCPIVLAAAADALRTLDDPTAAPALAGALGSNEWAVRDAAANALVRLGERGVDAVLERRNEIPACGIAHMAGALDVADRLDAIIDRAAAGDREMDLFVRLSSAAGVRSRLHALAESQSRASSAYAAGVLAQVGAKA
jgi:hypothetical protein